MARTAASPRILSRFTPFLMAALIYMLRHGAAKWPPKFDVAGPAQTFTSQKALPTGLNDVVLRVWSSGKVPGGFATTYPGRTLVLLTASTALTLRTRQ